MTISLTIKQACKVSGIGKTKLYELINSGALPAKKLGKSTFILKSDLENFLTNLEEYKTEGGA